MRLAIISPTFPPDVCGVGDYSFNLSCALTQEGHEVLVWTAQKHPKVSPISPSKMTPFNVDPPWGIRTFYKLIKEAARQNPDAFLIQYTPYLFAPKLRGIHLFLPFYLGLLRIIFNKPILLIAHELHYPIHFTLPGILLGIPHFLQFLGLIHITHKTVFAYDAPAQYCRRRFPWIKQKFNYIPVGTNIHSLTAEKPMDSRLHGLPKDLKVLIHFGRAHPTNLFSYALKALKKAQEKFGKENVKLFFIGISEEKLNLELEKVGESKHSLNVEALGYLTESQASHWLSRANLLLAPFMDGISTRRTSVMAALAHQKPVVTTRSWSTSEKIPWERFTAITSLRSLVNPEDEYCQKSLSLLSNRSEAEALARSGKEYFDKNFSWPVITKAFLELL